MRNVMGRSFSGTAPTVVGYSHLEKFAVSRITREPLFFGRQDIQKVLNNLSLEK